jgi:hypothetical protein
VVTGAGAYARESELPETPSEMPVVDGSVYPVYEKPCGRHSVVDNLSIPVNGTRAPSPDTLFGTLASE